MKFYFNEMNERINEYKKKFGEFEESDAKKIQEIRESPDPADWLILSQYLRKSVQMNESRYIRKYFPYFDMKYDGD